MKSHVKQEQIGRKGDFDKKGLTSLWFYRLYL